MLRSCMVHGFGFAFQSIQSTPELLRSAEKVLSTFLDSISKQMREWCERASGKLSPGSPVVPLVANQAITPAICNRKAETRDKKNK